jgi:SH3-like domain-containing protein
MRQPARTVLSLATAALLASPAVAQERPVPYWASIAAGQAMMRTGPDRSYPGIWLYKRRDLPVRVVQVHGAWRRVQDMDGTTGWMLAILLAARRTGIVQDGYRPIHAEASEGSRLLWQAEKGVVGRIAKCDGTWCRIEIGERRGWIQQAGLWGTDPAERVE